MDLVLDHLDADLVPFGSVSAKYGWPRGREIDTLSTANAWRYPLLLSILYTMIV